jgi:two-component system sensor histidine kinase/response regulator
MQDHVSKPVDPGALFRAIARWSKRRGGVIFPTAAAKGTAPSSGKEDIPLIEGLDTVSGLKRTAGNPRLYLDILRKYIEGQSGVIQRIREALAAGDRSTAERLVHTAKGVSGNIGAGGVQAVCAELEEAVRAGSETPDVIARCDDALSVMIGRLRSALGGRTQSELGSAPVGAARLTPVLRKIGSLLNDNDADVIDVMIEHSAMLRAALREDAYREIEKLIGGFEFEAAVFRLNAALKANNIEI